MVEVGPALGPPLRPRLGLAFGEPIEPTGDASTEEDVDAFLNQVREALERQLAEARDPGGRSLMSTSPPAAHDAAYRRKLLFLLSSATFFEGYDNFVLSFVLALVLVDLGGTEAQAGWIRAIVGLGAAVGFLLSAQADRIGRKRLLLITSSATRSAPPSPRCPPTSPSSRARSSCPRSSSASEWAVAITIVTEEFPSEERGRALGIVTSMNTLGGIAVGVLAFLRRAAVRRHVAGVTTCWRWSHSP